MKGYARWYDLDLKEVIDLRSRFFEPRDDYRMIAASALDSAWMEQVGVQGRVLIVAEGLLMYFDGEQVRSLLAALADRFPGAELLIEMLAPILVDRIRYHDTVKNGATFRWSEVDARALERYDDRIRYDGQWSYFDYCPARWRYLRLLGPFAWVRAT